MKTTPPGLPDNYWGFLTEHLPKYYSRQDVRENNILDSFLHDFYSVSAEDLIWVWDIIPEKHRKGNKARKYIKQLFRASCYRLYKEARENRKTRGPI